MAGNINLGNFFKLQLLKKVLNQDFLIILKTLFIVFSAGNKKYAKHDIDTEINMFISTLIQSLTS